MAMSFVDRRVEPELLLGARDRHLLRVDDERRHAARALRLRVGAREQDERAAERRIRDPLLRAGDLPAAVDRLGARRVSAPASEPEPDSVSAKQPTRSPLASGGTNRARCSSVPNWRIGSVHADVCTATVTPTPASARESSSSTRMYERKSAPAPPYSSGTQTPIRPSSASDADQLARETVVAIPGRGVRFDLGLREIAGERLDLALLRRELEVHGGHTSAVRIAARSSWPPLALTACGGHHARSPDGRRAQLERRSRTETTTTPPPGCSRTARRSSRTTS